jgi:hypothetical protein
MQQLGGKRKLYRVSRSTITCGSTMSVGVVRLKLIVDGTAFVAYLDDRVAMSGRMYTNGRGRLGFFVNGNSVAIEELLLRTP